MSHAGHWGAGALGTVTAALLLATLAGAGTASATPTPLASTHDSTVTDDGWQLNLDATELTANPMSNLANSPFSREGEFTAKVAGTITGTGTENVQSAVVEQYLIVGCQIDVSSGATLGLTASIGPNVGVSIGATGPSANAGLSASVGPSIQTTIKPGTITEIPLGKKEFQRNRASVTVKRVHIKVDGCMGPTSIRSGARMSVSTATADDTLNVFSARTWL
jgi:hypothetical protein